MAENKKYFFTYAGTLEAFQASAHPTTYATQGLVLIENGGKPVLYSGGKYIKSAENADNKFFNGVTIDGQTYDLTLPDKIKFRSGDNVKVDLSNGEVKVSCTYAFTALESRVTTLETNLGTKEDTAASDGSAFARIAQLQSDIDSLTGGNGSISEQINNAINALDVAAPTSGDYIKSISQVDGKIVPETGTFNFDEAGAAATAESNAKSYTDGKITDLSNGAIKANSDAIAILNGEATQAGSVKKTVTDAIAEVVASAPEDLDTLKEIADYIASDKTNAAEMNNAISANATAITEVKGKAITSFDTDEEEDMVVLQPKNINGSEGDYVYLKAANDGQAGVMTAQMHKDLYSAKAKAEANETAINTLKEDALKTLSVDDGDAYLGERVVIDGEDVDGSTDSAIIVLNGATTTKAGVMTAAQVTALNGKADASAVYTKEEVDAMFTFGVLA